MFAVIGANISADSVSFSNDLSLWFPTWINARKGAYVCCIISVAATPWKIQYSAASFSAFLGGYANVPWPNRWDHDVRLLDFAESSFESQLFTDILISTAFPMVSIYELSWHSSVVLYPIWRAWRKRQTVRVCRRVQHTFTA
jgi:hypothetical protein